MPPDRLTAPAASNGRWGRCPPSSASTWHSRVTMSDWPVNHAWAAAQTADRSAAAGSTHAGGNAAAFAFACGLISTRSTPSSRSNQVSGPNRAARASRAGGSMAALRWRG